MRIVDVPAAPDSAARVLPQLAAAAGAFPATERLERLKAGLIFLARENAITGAWTFVQGLGENECLECALRILLFCAGSESAAATMFVRAMNEASAATSFPEESPPRNSRMSPDPSPPHGTSPPQRATSEAAFSPAAMSHRIIHAEAFGVVYAVPRAARHAAAIIAVATMIARAPAVMPSAEVLAALPLHTLSTLAVINSAVDRALLATEELAVLRIGDAPKVLLALRMCRSSTPMLEPEELTAWLDGQIPLFLNGVLISWHGSRAVAAREPAPKRRTCNRCGRTVPEKIAWSEHHNSPHCKPSGTSKN